eukprot:CAMPEP_0184678484 /NCGR_PEP_ID=MMETSP0312-20130426/1221_1 /TAXON_ID=31354 /ORGANISM="Compsopogon coeruleus, Strain SAG 36.94" /LENGTH=262 /DNA_ID=CAMNT_0027127247 /DNA_START=48 /DNA_END=833 /DNA_ORIENTATION=-
MDIVIVTGCSQGGIGHALCSTLHRTGRYRVFAACRSIKKAVDLAEMGIVVVEMDVTDDVSVRKGVGEVLAQTDGVVDLVINNAGISCSAAVLDLPLEEAARVYDTNVVGALRVIREVASRSMVPRRRGKIVNVGSVVGLVPTPLAGAYAASKAALHAYSDVLRMELSPFGVQVMVIAPGAIKSNISQNQVQHNAVFFGLFPETMVKNRLVASQVGSSTPTQKFAEDCVRQIDRKSIPSYFIAGSKALLFRIFYHAPSFITDW